jgi:CRP-like cAMP-binding protein
MREGTVVQTSVRPSNTFLESLSASDFRLLQPHLLALDFKRGVVLFEAGAAITYAYFPTGAVVSMVVVLSVGETVEAGMIGCDGVVGVSSALDGPNALNQAIVQIAGSCVSISRRNLKAAVVESDTLRAQLYRHDQFMLAQAQQSAACLAKHDVVARMCRWLLRTRDLTGTDTIPLTQEFLGQMLGVRRPSVTVTAATLEKAGLIDYRRGLVKILDPDALHDAACECYGAVNSQYRALVSRRSVG